MMMATCLKFLILDLSTLDGVESAYKRQRTSISSSSMPSTPLSPPLKGRPMPPRGIPWFCSTTATATGGSCGSSKTAVLVSLARSRHVYYLTLILTPSPSISGYLPAEHIETPTERLARLNKHRNVDVSREGALNFDQQQLTSCSFLRPCSETRPRRQGTPSSPP